MSQPVLPAYLRTKLVSHAERVCKLYKAAIYDIKAREHDPLIYRRKAVFLRARFEENRDIKDMAVAKTLLEEGWAEFNAKRSPYTFYYANSPGGVAYQRGAKWEDHVLDQWHPLEKQQYPDYFAKREKRKQEMVDEWVKRYGSLEEETAK